MQSMYLNEALFKKSTISISIIIVAFNMYLQYYGHSLKSYYYPVLYNESLDMKKR